MTDFTNPLRRTFKKAVIGIALVTGMAGLSSCDQWSPGVSVVAKIITQSPDKSPVSDIKSTKDVSETFDIVTPGVSPVLYMGKKIKAAQKSGDTAKLRYYQQKLERLSTSAPGFGE
jgi:hypothetical protein